MKKVKTPKSNTGSTTPFVAGPLRLKLTYVSPHSGELNTFWGECIGTNSLS